MIISVTRLRLRSWHHVARFMHHTLASLLQAVAAQGFLDGRLLVGRRLTFWTVTRWSSLDAMRQWQAAGAHGRAMPFLMEWSDEASVARWEQPDDALFPDWQECHRRMSSQGRALLVRLPSDARRAGTEAKAPLGQGLRLELPFRSLRRA